MLSDQRRDLGPILLNSVHLNFKGLDRNGCAFQKLSPSKHSLGAKPPDPHSLSLQPLNKQKVL